MSEYRLPPWFGPPDDVVPGVGFADGRQATNLRRHRGFDDEARPDPPVLACTRGEGRDSRLWDLELWVWGLPPPGPLAFVCEWPARGIAESRMETDARLVLDAAQRAVPLWPEA